jgi:protein-disulfide isomerase
MQKAIVGGVSVLGVVAVAAAVGYLFTKDMGPFSGQVKSDTAVVANATQGGAGAVGSVMGKPVGAEGLNAGEKVKIYDAQIAVYNAYDEILSMRYLDAFFDEYMKEKGLANRKAAQDAYIKEKAVVSDAQVKEILEQNKENPRLKSLAPAEAEAQVRKYLEGQSAGRVMQMLVAQGRETNAIVNSMQKPVEPRLEVGDGGNPSLGAKDAKVTIVEFADYQCPYCARMVPTLMDVVKKYEGKVRWVYRDFPLDFHQNAKPAALAANCAGEQGKYFDAHNYLFENYASLGEDLYAKMVDTLKLDKAKFDACRKDPKQEAEIMADYEEGQKIGVNGTPAYFVNGRRMGGMDAAAFSRVIDEELARN